MWWVNGHPAGEHEGGLTPFTVDVSNYVNFGSQNTLTLKVTDPEAGTRW